MKMGLRNFYACLCLWRKLILDSTFLFSYFFLLPTAFNTFVSDCHQFCYFDTLLLLYIASAMSNSSNSHTGLGL